jgi:peptidoglycan hydrolase-like protein with peptidoglycan-binding domain
LLADPVLGEVAAGDRVMRRNDARQPGVGTLQDAFNQLGAQHPAFRLNLGPGNRDRGIFGSQTEAAVRALQAAQRIGIDGVVGMDTIAALDRALLELAGEPVGGEAGRHRGGELRFSNINATEFGGGTESGMPSAYGGEVNPDQPEASLPARLARERRRIVVRNPANSRSVECKVNDVGPWNTRDPYWDEDHRPLAEAQFRDGTAAQNGDVPTNDAGVDLTPAAMEALGVNGPVNTRQAQVDWDFV